MLKGALTIVGNRAFLANRSLAAAAGVMPETDQFLFDDRSWLNSRGEALSCRETQDQFPESSEKGSQVLRKPFLRLWRTTAHKCSTVIRASPALKVYFKLKHPYLIQSIYLCGLVLDHCQNYSSDISRKTHFYLTLPLNNGLFYMLLI